MACLTACLARTPTGLSDGTFQQMMPEYTQHFHLLHYYQKSTEEWLVKTEQSVPPYNRYIPDYYDNVNFCPAGLTEVLFLPEYERVVGATIEQLRRSQDQEDGGLFLGTLPESTKEEYAEAEQDYELYLYLKLKIAQGQDWDEEGYLKSIPEVRKAIEEQEYVDGLQHLFKKALRNTAAAFGFPII